MGTFAFAPTAEISGTFNLYTLGHWDQAELSAGKYIIVFQQNSPDRYFAQVVNLVDSSTSPTFGAQQTVESTPATSEHIFVVSLSATKAVAIYHNSSDGKLTMRVLNVDGGDAITVGTAAAFTLTNQPTDRFVSSGFKRMDAVAIDASNFYVWHNSSNSNGSTWQLSKFNVSGDTITQSGSTTDSRTLMGGSWAAETTFAANHTWKISKALSAGEFIVQAGRSAGVIDGSLTKVSDLSSSLTEDEGVVFEIATDKYVDVRRNHFLRYNVGGVWGDIVDYSDTNTAKIKDVFRMNDTYFGMIQFSSNQYIQFVRNLNDALWQHQENSTPDQGFDIFTTVTNNSKWWEGSSRIGEIGEIIYTIDASNFAIFHAPTDAILEFTVITQA